ncbi:transcriptional regulator [Opitutaceae bacterium TAV5]|nr:transcriptional regulator [Opitutaceae bacterium TAV5]
MMYNLAPSSDNCEAGAKGNDLMKQATGMTDGTKHDGELREGKPGSGGVQSLQRGLAVLERVSQAEDGLTLGRLSELTGLKKTTVHNLARTLLEDGYLARLTQPVRYAAGPALAALARRNASANTLHLAAEPALLALAAEFPGSAALLVEAAGAEVRVTLRVSPENPASVERPLDRLSPPYISATSLVFLALGSNAWREACMSRYPFADFGAPLWGSFEALEAQLDKIRKERRAVLDRPGATLAPMAFPVTGSRGELLAALGLAFRPAQAGGALAAKRRALSRTHELAQRLGARFGGGA